MHQAKKNMATLSKEEKRGIGKALKGKLSLNEKQKRIQARVKAKISCMSAKEKLKCMSPAGVQKLLDEATKEIEAEDS